MTLKKIYVPDEDEVEHLNSMLVCSLNFCGYKSDEKSVLTLKNKIEEVSIDMYGPHYDTWRYMHTHLDTCEVHKVLLEFNCGLIVCHDTYVDLAFGLLDEVSIYLVATALRSKKTKAEVQDVHEISFKVAREWYGTQGDVDCKYESIQHCVNYWVAVFKKGHFTKPRGFPHDIDNRLEQLDE